MENYLSTLNTQQLEAVTTTEGFVRVIAGAGSGKTRALSHRFAYLVNELGIMPGSILCVTFTNKSANEMRQRIHNLTGDNDTGFISTFHGFCNTILLEESYAISYPKNFIVLDNADIDEMLRIIYEERNLTLRHMTFSKARDMIEIMKLAERPDYYLNLIHMSVQQLKEKYLRAHDPRDIIFYGYLYQEKKCFGLDYNDLIILTLHIFDEHEDIKQKWQEKLEYIMIDEFQDIDDLQYKLMKCLCGFHKNLLIVGDPDQTIYTWRGARIRYLIDFDNDFPNVRTIMMPKNYRSTPEILHAANSLIANNEQRIKKDLVPVKEHGPMVRCHEARTEAEEAQWVCEQIKALSKQGIEYRDIAILYRAHYITRSIEDVFIKEELPYTIYSGIQFYARKEIKDTLSYLRMIVFKDDLSFIRTVNTPKRNIGERRMKFLKNYAGENNITLYDTLKLHLEDELFRTTQAKQYVELIEQFAQEYEGRQVSEVLTAMLDQSGYEKMLRTEGSQERLDNLAELKQSILDYEISCGEEADLEHYLSHIALFTNADLEMKHNSVKLMTIHTAKGLEFDHVFLIGMNEGMFPTKKVSTLEAMEEERRLAFVAMTRAKKSLYLTEANGRNFDGSPKYPSRFILDIDPRYIEFTPPMSETLIDDARQYIEIHSRFLKLKNSMPEFKEGDLVEHPVFGKGTIIQTDPLNMIHTIHFDKLKTERKISYRAKLKKIGENSLSEIMN